MSEIDELFERLLSANLDDGYVAGFALHKLGRRVIDIALNLAKDLDSKSRDMACFVLARVLIEGVEQDIVYPTYYNHGVPILLELLKNDEVPAVRHSAAVALSFHMLPCTLRDICRVGYDPDPMVKFGVAQAIGNMSISFWDRAEVSPYLEDVEKVLLHLSDDKDDNVRDWTAFAFRHVANKSQLLRMKLIQLTNDKSETVAEVARDALEGLLDNEWNASELKIDRTGIPEV